MTQKLPDFSQWGLNCTEGWPFFVVLYLQKFWIVCKKCGNSLYTHTCYGKSFRRPQIHRNRWTALHIKHATGTVQCKTMHLFITYFLRYGTVPTYRGKYVSNWVIL